MPDVSKPSDTAIFAAARWTDNKLYGTTVEKPARGARRWILNGFDMSTTGHIVSGLWKHPLDRSSEYHTIKYWQDLAKLLERGKFNGIFIADCLGAYDVFAGPGNAGPALESGAQYGVDDPMMVISAAAAVTKNLSFGITHSVTYEQPFTLARRFSTLDHLTEGRVAINVVTSILESSAKNMGLDQPIEHDERYRRADEYMEVLYKLWESSWREDAILKDVKNDRYGDSNLIRPIDHSGKYFKVRGPAMNEPSKQRTPVLYQAGSSTAGISFAAKHAEAVFMSGPSPAKIRAQVDDLRAQTAAQGRDPYSIKVIVQVSTVIDETEEKAEAKAAEYRTYSSPTGAQVLFGGWTGQDLSLYDEEAELREVGNPAVKAIASGFAKLYPEIKKWTRLEVVERMKLGGLGLPTLIGSPQTVADKLQIIIDEADIDGFNFSYVTSPGSFEDLVNFLVPELQKRGVHWLDYPSKDSNESLTAREGLYGVGQVKVRADHYASKFSWNAGQKAPSLA